MTHPKAKLALGAVVVAAVAVPLVWQERTIATVRQQNRALAAQNEAVDRRQAEQRQFAEQQARAEEEMEQAGRDREELNRLRREVVSLRDRIQQAGAAAQATGARAVPAVALAPAAAGDFLKLDEARDVGTGTGKDLLQTFFWAMRTGDTNRLVALGDWSAEGAEEAVAEMMREVPQMAASAEIQDMTFRILNEEPLADGDAAVVVEMGKGTDRTKMGMRIRRAGAGWRVVMGRNGPQEVNFDEEQPQP